VTAAAPATLEELAAQFAESAAPTVEDVVGGGVVLPPWRSFHAGTGIAAWEGGVQVLGDMVKIHGRTIDHEHLDDARQHALAVLAAVAHVEQLAEVHRG
jgi:hypothetical protein